MREVRELCGWVVLQEKYSRQRKQQGKDPEQDPRVARIEEGKSGMDRGLGNRAAKVEGELKYLHSVGVR